MGRLNATGSSTTFVCMDAVWAFQGDRGGQIVGYLLLSLLSLAAGVAALVWPGIGVVLAIRPNLGAVTLAIVLGLYSIVIGVYAIALAVRNRRVEARAPLPIAHPAR